MMPGHMKVSYTVWNTYESELIPKAGRELMILKVITLIWTSSSRWSQE